MKNKYFMICFFVSILLFNSYIPVNANTTSKYDDMPYYIETTISDAYNASGVILCGTNQTVTKTKTTKAKAQDGTILWTVSITATFTYNGTTSKCTSCTPNAASYAQAWSIKSVTSSKSGNTATATAIATHANGSLSHDFKQSVTIQCSKNGTVS